jgi:epoxide hydrolase-like predicted phosphatase
MKIEAGIFDLGKVVVHSDGGVLLSEVRQELNLDDKKLRQVAADLGNTIGTGTISEEEYLRQLDENAPLDLFKRSFKRDFRLFDETIDILRSLKEKRIKLAALSNTIPQHVEVMSERRVFDYFDIRVLSCEVGLRKPDARVYELTLRKLGIAPEQTFFTDDKEENLRAATELGIIAILFENPSQLKRDLRNLGLVV